jgi:hypothetical protein
MKMKLKKIDRIAIDSELVLASLGFNLVTGYHESLKIHVNTNSSREITLLEGYDKAELALLEKMKTR